MNRILISYRNSDGFKDANRLAVDLDRVFGKDQVFLDKQDLRGGSSWRDEIMTALGAKPVVLALITPDYFGAVDGNGRRIDHEDDPVRAKFTTPTGGSRSSRLRKCVLGAGLASPRSGSLSCWALNS